jgi:formylglycine-generating enzyme required for sulfatase activity
VWVPKVPETGTGCWVGKYEVTQGQYEQIMGNCPSHWPTPKHPVSQVKLSEAKEFCTKLSNSDTEKRNNFQYDLPSAKEWGRLVANNDAFSNAVVSFGLEKLRANPDPVDSLPPSKLGLCGILGNVSEWTSDSYAKGYDYRSVHVETVSYGVPQDANTPGYGIGFRCIMTAK